MKPDWYVDFTLEGCDQTDITLPVVANTVYRVMHGAFRSLTPKFAVALPESGPGKTFRHVGDRIRVFAEAREHLDQLVDAVGNHPSIRDYARILYPKSVPGEYQGSWVSYRRYRTSNRNAGRKEGDTLNARRTAYALEKQLPYLKIWSKSTERYFSLFIEVVKETHPPSVQGEPDSYGLCVSSRPLALPDISVS